jgi:hypothetical protein
MGKGAGRRSHSLSFPPARYMLSVSSSPSQSSGSRSGTKMLSMTRRLQAMGSRRSATRS